MWEIGQRKVIRIRKWKIKVIDEGVFWGHCLLASHGAYDDSCLLEVASENKDNELVEALNKDIVEISNRDKKR